MPDSTTETENVNEVTTEDRQDAEVSAEALEAVAQATARAEFEDALRPPQAAPGGATPADPESGDDGQDGADSGTEDDDGGDGDGKPNREAAKLRHRAQTAEAERDALATQLEAMQRAAIDSHVGTMGMKPAALWASGAELGDLLAEDGTPDTAKVAAAAQAAKEALGVQVYTKPRAGLQSGAMARQPRRDKWIEAFGPQPS